MAQNIKPLPQGGEPSKKAKRKPNSARLAKLVIQRRTLALLLVFGVGTFLALFAKAYDLAIVQHNQLQDGASSQQMSSTVTSASSPVPSFTAVILLRPGFNAVIFPSPSTAATLLFELLYDTAAFSGL